MSKRVAEIVANSSAVVFNKLGYILKLTGRLRPSLMSVQEKLPRDAIIVSAAVCDNRKEDVEKILRANR